jgi:cytochrome c-type biogenesis protein
VSLELTSVPLALVAGMLSILSPCVWPLVPVVLASSKTGGRFGPWFLALGLSTAFGIAGTVVTWMLLTLGLSPDALRSVSAAMRLLVAVALLIPAAGQWLMFPLARLSSHLESRTRGAVASGGQFGVGLLLGLVWLPCVGPTLGAAIALASLGQELLLAFMVMFTFGAGTAAMLMVAAFASGNLLRRVRPQLLSGAGHGKILLGSALLILSVLVFTGFDKVLETLAITILPDWAISI